MTKSIEVSICYIISNRAFLYKLHHYKRMQHPLWSYHSKDSILLVWQTIWLPSTFSQCMQLKLWKQKSCICNF